MIRWRMPVSLPPTASMPRPRRASASSSRISPHWTPAAYARRAHLERSAASRCVAPAMTAAKTRSRGSTDKAFDMPAGLRPADSLNQLASIWESRFIHLHVSCRAVASRPTAPAESRAGRASFCPCACCRVFRRRFLKDLQFSYDAGLRGFGDFAHLRDEYLSSRHPFARSSVSISSPQVEKKLRRSSKLLILLVRPRGIDPCLRRERPLRAAPSFSTARLTDIDRWACESDRTCPLWCPTQQRGLPTIMKGADGSR